MKHEKKILCYCINVFNITPTFLLPVFKNEIDNTYYAQKSENNKIINFEEIEINKYRLYSKIYDVDTYVKYEIGSDTVYSIDYETGFLFGTREIIISFYRNNIKLFNDEFTSYMSDFIAYNQDVIKNTNFALEKISKGEPNHNNDLIFNKLDIRRRSFHGFRGNFDKINVFLNDSLLEPKRIMQYNLGNTHKYYCDDFIIDNYSIVRELFKELFNKPPIYNLWNDRIINSFTSFEYFCEKINVDVSFPEGMFKNFNYWKKTQLVKDANEKFAEGYGVYYIQIQNIFDNIVVIIAQNYYSKRNYIKLYRTDLSSYDFIEFSIGLIKDTKKKVCFIAEEQNLSALLDNYFIKQIHLHDINIIFPPQNHYNGVKNKQIWW